MNRGVVLVLLVLGLAAGAYLLWPRTDERAGAAGYRSARPDAPPDVSGAPLEAGGPSLAGTGAPTRGATTSSKEDPEAREIAGLVVDDGGKPVAGAEVRLTSGRPEDETSTPTDADGAFSLRVRFAAGPSARWGVLTARHGTRVGHAPAWLRADGGRDGKPVKRKPVTIRLVEGLALDVHVTSGCPGGVPARVWVLWPDFPDAPPFAMDATDASGKVRFSGLAPGLRRVVAAAEGCGRVEAVVTLPRPNDEPLALEVPTARTLTVTVVEKGSGRPIAGATVEVRVTVRAPNMSYSASAIPLPAAFKTGSDGRVAVTGLGPADALHLRARAEGYPEPAGGMRGGGPGEARVKAGETEARIELALPRTIRWPVKAGTAPIPPDGAEIRLRPHTDHAGHTPAQGRMEGGQLVVEGWGPGYAAAFAHAPGGAIASLQAAADAELGVETAFFVARTIEAIVTLESEGPAKGWSVMASDLGNNPVAAAVRTDAAGTARLTDLYAGPMSIVNVYASPGRDDERAFTLGTVDLSRQDGRLEVTLPREREVAVAVKIDGAPGLPPPPLALRIHSTWISEPVRDEATSELRFRWRPPPGVTETDVSMQLAGFVPTSARVRLEPGSGVVLGALDLQRAATLLVRVELPKDKRHSIAAQAFDEAKGAWPHDPVPHSDGMGGFGRAKADDSGIARIGPLKPGRYRVYDALSGIVSTEVRVMPGEPPAEVRLDLRNAGWIQGRVETSDGDLTGAWVERADRPARPEPGTLGTSGSVGVDKEGRFWFRTAGDAPIRLRARHHALRADPPDGIEVEGPREGVTLRLVKGPTAVVRFEREVMGYVNRGSPRPLAVRLYRGEPLGEPQARLTAMLDGNGLRATFGGFEPGTWTAWIDTPPFAPVVLRDVVFGTGQVDLGPVTLSDGSRFVLEVKVKAGQDAPRYSIWIEAEDGERLVRQGELFTGSEGKVTGIPRGRFRVSASGYGAGRALFEVIEFDGTSEVRRVIDLR